MFNSTSPVYATVRRKPLAACLAVMFCLAAPAATIAATIWTVDTCDDANAGTGTIGSLRYAAANAVSGDTLDMTGLTCSTISLTTGAVRFAQADITLKGPGKAALTISGMNSDRVFHHSGSGTLNAFDLTVSDGYFHPSEGIPASGGCIVSNGSVFLSQVGVHACHTHTVNAVSRGGGVYAAHDFFALKYSDISGNSASTSSPAVMVEGGGVFAYGDFILLNSTISDNQAKWGGGVRVFGNVSVNSSTISGNIAMRGGGIYANDDITSGADSFTLRNSTVSGNLATELVGGVWTNAGTIDVENSTVAFNTSGSASDGYSARHFAAGFSISDWGGTKVVTLQSSLIANNTLASPSVGDDWGVAHSQGVGNTTPTSGENNLVRATTAFVPVDTITGVCPLLGPLRNNGGPTATHALLGGSPGIDHGNNFGNNLNGQMFDQRGSPFVRVSGAAADIGAYEVQQGDILFSDGFDGIPTCSD